MKKGTLQKVTCSVMATAVSISPFLPMVEIFASTPSELFNSEIETLLTEDALSALNEQPETDSTTTSLIEQPILDEVLDSTSTEILEDVETDLSLSETPVLDESIDESVTSNGIIDETVNSDETPVDSSVDSPTNDTTVVETQTSALAEELEMMGEESKSSTTFYLSDWNYTTTSTSIVITGSKTNRTSVYIPGQYNGKQIILKDLKVFPSNMTHLTIEAVNGKKVGVQSTYLSSSFSGNKKLQVADLRGLDVSKVTTMSWMFSNASNLQSVNMRGLNTANVTDMSFMFYGCESLTYVNLTSINTAKVQRMNDMFYNVKSLTSLNLSSFNTKSVQTMNGMFDGMQSIKSLSLASFNTSNVIDMGSMFKNMKSLTSLDISSFDTSKVQSMHGMFAYAASLEKLDLSHFKTGNVQYMGGMFFDMEKLKSLNVSSFDTRKVTSMAQMFAYTFSLNEVDLSSFKTTAVTDMSQMFIGSSLFSLNLSHFNTSKVTDMSQMFQEMPYLTTLTVNGWNTSNVTDMDWMFAETPLLTHLDLSSFKTTNLKKADYMFYRTLMLTYLDLSQFDLSKVEGGISNMFYRFYDDFKRSIFIFTNDSKIHQYDFNRVSLNATVVGHSTVKPTMTSLSGKATAGTTIALVNTTTNKTIASTTVGSSGSYSLSFPQQTNTSLLKLKATNNLKETATKNLHLSQNFKTFTITTQPSASTTAIYGTGEAGAKVGIYTKNGTRLAITTVNSKGNYKLVIPKQKGGTVLTVKQAKSGYNTVSKSVTVLYEFNKFTLTTQPTPSTTAIYGTGVAGAKVGIYDKNGKRLAITTVNSKGNYKLTIPKQKVNTVLTIKQAKSGYLTASKKVTVLNQFKTFSVTTKVTPSTTAIYGKGVAGSKVGIYNKNGKRLAITTVNSKGNYKLTIPKQKGGTVLTVKQAKSGYLTVSKKLTVLKNFSTFTVPSIHTYSTGINGKGVPGAKVGIYDKNGKCLDITTVNSIGSYWLWIPKQKAGTVLTIKQAASGYVTASKTVKVVKY